jgi:VanZ family protein|tara:strand:+ start:4730 stop:5110 length:381 start_codon:yes stop_codon:yes gene_type:complete
MLVKIRYQWCFKLLIVSVIIVGFLLGVPMSTFSKGFNSAFSEITILDEIAHISIFFVISLLFYGSFHMKRRFLIGLVMAMGATTEVMQGMVGRSASFSDFLADSLGVVFAMTLVSVVLIYKNNQKS